MRNSQAYMEKDLEIVYLSIAGYTHIFCPWDFVILDRLPNIDQKPHSIVWDLREITFSVNLASNIS